MIQFPVFRLRFAVYVSGKKRTHVRLHDVVARFVQPSQSHNNSDHAQQIVVLYKLRTSLVWVRAVVQKTLCCQSRLRCRKKAPKTRCTTQAGEDTTTVGKQHAQKKPRTRCTQFARRIKRQKNVRRHFFQIPLCRKITRRYRTENNVQLTGEVKKTSFLVKSKKKTARGKNWWNTSTFSEKNTFTKITTPSKFFTTLPKPVNKLHTHSTAATDINTFEYRVQIRTTYTVVWHSRCYIIRDVQEKYWSDAKCINSWTRSTKCLH